MFKKLRDRYKNYLGRYRIYKVLKKRFPHLKKFPELEKAMGDWDKARNYLIELEKRGYVQERDDEGVGYTDDIYYGLTPDGLDKLSEEFSLWRKVRPVWNIVKPILIIVIAGLISAYLIKKLLK